MSGPVGHDGLSHGDAVVRIRPGLRPRPVDGEGLFLLSDHDTQFFEGQVFVDLCALLETGTSRAAAADQLAGTHDRAVTHYALDLLDRGQVLTTDGRTGGLAVFLDESTGDLATTRRRLAEARVAVTALSGADPGATVDALAAFGIQAGASAHPAPQALQVVLTTDYLDPDLEPIGRRNHEDRRTWLLARTTGASLWIGPWFAPTGPCYACLAFVLGRNRAVDRYVARKTGSRVGLTGSAARTAAHDLLVAGLVALHTLRWLAGSPAEHQVRVLDLRDLGARDHPVRRRPQCGVCGDPELQTRLMTAAPRVGAADTADGAGLADLRRLVSPVTGLVSTVEPTPSGLWSGYTATAYCGFGGDASDLPGFKSSALSQGAGVGTTAEEAEHGALCEALERYSCTTIGDEPWVLARYADLDPATTVNPTACMLYSESQYERRDEINRRGAAFDVVPEPFDEQAPLAWTGVWSLSADRFKLLPSSFLFYFFPQTSGPYCWADSNGCAAGTSLTDAVTRGLYELVERDTVAIWWYNRLARPGLELEATRDPELCRIRDAHHDLGREVWALDLTADLGIPTYAAVSRRPGAGSEDIVLGFGADLDPRRAVRHAVLEMNHILPAVLPAHRTADGDYPYPEPAQKDWWRSASVENQPYLLPTSWLDDLTAVTPGRVESAPARPLEHLLTTLEAAGLEVLVLDMTRPDVGLPVAKVVVPGLRHFWARLAPGRLYDVPVSLGWLSAPTPEQDLNPISMFL